MIALATPAIPQFNPQLGVGELAAKAVEVAEVEKINRFAFYRFRSGENMDVYLGKPCEPILDIEQLDSLESLARRTILFVGYKEQQRDSLFAEWLEGRKRTEVGNYSFTIVGGKKLRLKLLDEAKPTTLQIDSTKLKKIR